MRTLVSSWPRTAPAATWSFQQIAFPLCCHACDSHTCRCNYYTCCSPYNSYARLPGATLCVRCVAGVAKCVTGYTGGCDADNAEAPSPGACMPGLLQLF
jgi:hypothetical protein